MVEIDYNATLDFLTLTNGDGSLGAASLEIIPCVVARMNTATGQADMAEILNFKSHFGGQLDLLRSDWRLTALIEGHEQEILLVVSQAAD